MKASCLSFPIRLLHSVNVFVIFPLIILIVLSDIILRTFFNSPLSWAHEVLGLLLLCLFFLELPNSLQKSELLSVDLLYKRFGRFGRAFSYRLSCLLILAFSLLLVWQGGLGVLDSLEYDEQAFTLPIPYWPFYALITLSGCLMLLQSFGRLFSSSSSISDLQNERLQLDVLGDAGEQK